MSKENSHDAQIAASVQHQGDVEVLRDGQAYQEPLILRDEAIEASTPERPAATTPEVCGCWVNVGGYRTICAFLENHEGRCLPSRNELMDEGYRLEEAAQAIWEAVAALDKERAWK